MILEGLLIVCIFFAILVFFYKQAVMEFRIAQTDSFDKVPSLLQEKIPIVIQPFLVPKQLWTHDDILQRHSLGNTIIPVIDLPLGQAIGYSGKMFPWKSDFASYLSNLTGLNVWTEQTIKTIFKKNSLLSGLYSYRTEVYLGPQGLQKTFGVATVIFATEGTAILTLINEQADPYLPSRWKGRLLSGMTRDDAPLIGQIQCIDVVLRTGSCIVLPPHWKYSLEEKAEDVKPICTVKVVVNHPISAFIEKVEENKN